MIRTIGLFLLLLLKILGWALLILLLFLIAVVFLILFVPVRYDVRMQNERITEPGQNNPIAGLRLQLKAYWLLHLLHVTVSYGPEGMRKQIRIAGIDIRKVLAAAKKRSHTAQESHNSTQTKSGTGQTQPEPENSSISFDAGTDTAEDRQISEESSVETGMVQSAEIPEAPSKTVTQRRRIKSEKKNKKKASKTEGQKKFSKRALKPQKESGSSQPGIFTKIRAQLSRLHKEFTDEVNRHAASHLWKELLKLLRSYKPKKLKADLTFSLANPALTGGAVGIISLMPWIYRYPCSIIPDFTSEKLYIEGKILARGKVAVYVFALSLLRLLRDKEFMHVIRRFMKREGS